MGKASRDKGYRFENGLVNLLRDVQIDARRIPLSGGAARGSAGKDYAGDITIPWRDGRAKFEVKKRASGFAMLYRWLGSHLGLIVAADRRESLVILRLSDFITLHHLAHPGQTVGGLQNGSKGDQEGSQLNPP